jgi:ABC-type nitrate/sulfonate/bicarbonate transport system ATPase subunit
MNVTTQKLELIQWISNLENVKLLNELAQIRIKNSKSKTKAKRYFGCGKNIIGEIAEDFNEPLDHFKEYQP